MSETALQIDKSFEALVQLQAEPWQQIMNAVARGEKTWEDFTFEERTCKGWLIPYLSELDAMFSGRWEMWTEAIYRNELPAKIPQIDFFDSPDPRVMAMLFKCLSEHSYDSTNSLLNFLEWIFWGFGKGEKPRLSEKVNEHWYRTFNLGLMLKCPYDYLGELLANDKIGRWNNPHAFFPTPHSVVKVLADLILEDCDMTNTVNDPCVGTGRMLLEASNKSLFLYAQDVDATCVMACLINGYLYAPWMVAPGLKQFQKKAPKIPPNSNVLEFKNPIKQMPKISPKKKKRATVDDGAQQLMLF